MNFVAITVTVVLLAVFTQPAECQYYLGQRGGCYTLSKSGNKRYVDRSMCASEPAAVTVSETRPAAASQFNASPAPNPGGSANGASSRFHLGQRGGCDTLSAGGSKRYVDRSLCESKPSATSSALVGRKTAVAVPVAPAGSSSRYHLGPRGGCYTITASGGKRYVDRGMCQ